MTSGRLRIFLTGRLCLETPTGVFDERAFPGRQARICFARLALEHGRPLTREQLANDLWPGALAAAWEPAIRAIVSKLRTLLERAGVAGATISNSAGAYRLDLPVGTWIDTEAAPEAIHRAEAALASADLADACGWALVARAIAARPFLPGCEGDWADRQRALLEQTLLRALACLAEVWLAHGDASLAARDAEEAIGRDPYREASHRLLIRAHLAAGDRGAASAAYQRCRRILREELGVEPSPETAALLAAVRLKPAAARASATRHRDAN